MKKYLDFGWGGAANAFWAIDMENEISIYFGAHLLSSPTQGIRSMIYRVIRADILNEDSEEIFGELKKLHNYTLSKHE